MYSLLKRSVLIGFVLVLTNCKDPVNLKTEGQGGILVVNGKLSTLEGPAIIKLGYTAFSNRTPLPVEGASIQVFNESVPLGNYEEIQPGVYQLPENTLTLVPTKTYNIEITLPDGKVYRSKPERVPDGSGTDTPYYEFGSIKEIADAVEITKNVINIYSDTELPGSEKPQCFKWDVEEVYMFEQTPIFDPLTGTIPRPCFITGYPDPQRITLFSTENVQTDRLTRKLLAVREIDFTFAARHYFVINLSSISREAYTYWKNADGLINRSGSIFDTPPAPLKGNMYNVDDPDETVYGYFEVTNTSVSRIYTIRSDVPFPVIPKCFDPAKGLYSLDYPSVCHYCLEAANSSLEKPDWF